MCVILLIEETNPMEKKLEDLEKSIKTHYRIYGYEKQGYLKEILDKFFGTTFKIFDEDE